MRGFQRENITFSQELFVHFLHLNINSFFCCLFARLRISKMIRSLSFWKFNRPPPFWNLVVSLLLLSDFCQEVTSQSPTCIADPSSSGCDSGHPMKLVIMTDAYGSETSWKLTKDDGSGTFIDFDSGSG